MEQLAEGGGSDEVGVVLHSKFKEFVGLITGVTERGTNRCISFRPVWSELLREELTLDRPKKDVLVALNLTGDGAV